MNNKRKKKVNKLTGEGMEKGYPAYGYPGDPLRIPRMGDLPYWYCKYNVTFRATMPLVCDDALRPWISAKKNNVFCKHLISCWPHYNPLWPPRTGNLRDIGRICCHRWEKVELSLYLARTIFEIKILFLSLSTTPAQEGNKTTGHEQSPASKINSKILRGTGSREIRRPWCRYDR